MVKVMVVVKKKQKLKQVIFFKRKKNLKTKNCNSLIIFFFTARISLDILIPDLKNTLNQEQNKSESSLNDLKFFDTISIEDQRVSELCLKAGQYSPYQILVECIKRFVFSFVDPLMLMILV